MADVVISYDHSDHANAATLAKEVEALGLTVWWDRKLIGGSRWSKVILDQLSTAGAVLVIWSRHSVHSEIVEDEARRALAAGKLVPLRTKDVEIGNIPLGLATRQILPLTDIERIAQAIVTRNPNAKSLFVMARAGLRANAHRELAECERLLARNPSDDALYVKRGYQHAMLKVFDKALADFDRALELRPGNAAAHVGRGSVFERQGLAANATTEYRKALAIEPSREGAHDGLKRLASKAITTSK